MSVHVGPVEMVYRSTAAGASEEVEVVEMSDLALPRVVEREGRPYYLVHWEVRDHSGQTPRTRVVYTDDPSAALSKNAGA